MDLVKTVEEAFAIGKQHPSFEAGNTVIITYRIVKSSKERARLYRDVIIKIVGRGDRKRFTIRKISGTIGTECTLPIRLPAADNIEANRVSKVRHARLYCLHTLTDKKAEIKEERVNG